MKTGIELIAEERASQIERGYTVISDCQHEDGELAEAAACYVVAGSAGVRGANAAEEFTSSMLNGYNDSLITWPWDDEMWNPSADPIKNLVRAGALIAAEIDRIQQK